MMLPQNPLASAQAEAAESRRIGSSLSFAPAAAPRRDIQDRHAVLSRRINRQRAPSLLIESVQCIVDHLHANLQ